MNLAPATSAPSMTHSHPPWVIALGGEIDIASVPALRERLNTALNAAAAAPTQRLIIDLSGVSFSDASGLALLVGVHRRARRLGTSICLAAPQPQIAKLLRTTGLDRSLTIHSTLAAAMPAYRSGRRQPPAMSFVQAVRGGHFEEGHH